MVGKLGDGLSSVRVEDSLFCLGGVSFFFSREMVEVSSNCSRRPPSPLCGQRPTRRAKPGPPAESSAVSPNSHHLLQARAGGNEQADLKYGREAFQKDAQEDDHFLFFERRRTNDGESSEITIDV